MFDVRKNISKRCTVSVRGGLVLTVTKLFVRPSTSSGLQIAKCGGTRLSCCARFAPRNMLPAFESARSVRKYTTPQAVENPHMRVFFVLEGGLEPRIMGFYFVCDSLKHSRSPPERAVRYGRVGRGLIVLLRSEACKTYSGPFETDRSAEMHFFPQPRPHFVRCAWGRTRTADPSLFRRML